MKIFAEVGSAVSAMIGKLTGVLATFPIGTTLGALSRSKS